MLGKFCYSVNCPQWYVRDPLFFSFSLLFFFGFTMTVHVWKGGSSMACTCTQRTWIEYQRQKVHCSVPCFGLIGPWQQIIHTDRVAYNFSLLLLWFVCAQVQADVDAGHTLCMGSGMVLLLYLLPKGTKARYIWYKTHHTLASDIMIPMACILYLWFMLCCPLLVAMMPYKFILFAMYMHARQSRIPN